MRSIALANQKGGVGKTTTAVHLAHGLAMTGQSVALLDLDPQGNATIALQGMVVDHPDESGPFGLLEALQDGFFLLPSPGAQRNLERDATLDAERLVGLGTSLDEAGLDWLLVDCPPRMDSWGWAGLQLCDEVLVPIQPEFFAMHGLSQMMQTLEEAQRVFDGKARLLGVLANLVDVREPVEVEVLADLASNLGERLMASRIFRDSQLVEAASHGLTAFEYNPFCKGARSYGELVREVLHGRS